MERFYQRIQEDFLFSFENFKYCIDKRYQTWRVCSDIEYRINDIMHYKPLNFSPPLKTGISMMTPLHMRKKSSKYNA